MSNQKFYLDKIKELGDKVADYVLKTKDAEVVYIFDRLEGTSFTDFYEGFSSFGKKYFANLKFPLDFDYYELFTPFNFEELVDLVWIRIVEVLHQTEEGKQILKHLYG
jgi:hypothetical protein